MRYPLLLVLMATIISCAPFGNGNDDLIQARWVFNATNADSLVQLAAAAEDELGVPDGFKQIFAASKFIIRPDHTFDFNLFPNYRHGKWQRRGNRLVIWPEPSQDSIQFMIDTVAYSMMQLTIDSSNFNKFGYFITPEDKHIFTSRRSRVSFRFQLDKERYSNLSKDPYSKQNNLWRIRPSAPENDPQLKERILNLVRFHQLMFQDAIDNDKSTVIYSWFSSPVIVASNGIALRKYERIQADWENYFYDSTQAAKAYGLLQQAFDKKINATKDIPEKFLWTKDLLEQLEKNVRSL